MADWLASERCTHVAMEATGVYWKPCLLEASSLMSYSDGDGDLVVANAKHVKNVPGRRKTNVNGATWLADLPAHGLISSVPLRNRIMLSSPRR